jgi:hypothetical protein
MGIDKRLDRLEALLAPQAEPPSEVLAQEEKLNADMRRHLEKQAAEDQAHGVVYPPWDVARFQELLEAARRLAAENIQAMRRPISYEHPKST